MRFNFPTFSSIILIGLIVGTSVSLYFSRFNIKSKFKNFENHIEEIIVQNAKGKGYVIFEGEQLEELGIDNYFSKVVLIRSEHVFEFYVRNECYVFVKSPGREFLSFSIVSQNEGHIVDQLNANWWLLRKR